MAHNERAHALLSASGAKRWLSCPPSARLSENFENKSSVFAEEGTFAHELSELEIKGSLKLITAKAYKTELAKFKANKQFYTAALHDHVLDYASFVVEQFSEAKNINPNTRLLLEQKIDFSRWVPEGFGSNDAAIVNDNLLHVIDLKFGQGVKVEAANNPQLMLYALGVYNSVGAVYEFDRIAMTIYQPRLSHVETWEVSAEDLLGWAEMEVSEKAKLAFNGEGEFRSGDHCKFCPVKPRCEALAKANLELAKHEFKAPELLDDDQIAEVLNKIDVLVDWADAVAAYALEEAKKGKKFSGFKLVEGRSVRSITDIDTAALKLDLAGFAEDQIYNKKLKGLGDLEKLVGKVKFASLLGDLIVKPAGAPTLVRDTDKRPELNSLEQAKQEFSTND